MAENDTIWLPVAPSFRGFGAQMVKEATGAAKQAGSRLNAELGKSGRDAGQAAGKGVADGMRSSAAAIEKASALVSQARKRESDAAAAVLLAEGRLEEARKKGASSETLARQEVALEQARRRQMSAASQLSAAEKDMEAVRNGGQGRAQAVIRSEGQLEKARLDSARAADQVALAEAKVAELQYKGEQSASKVAKAQADLVKARSAQASASDTLRAKEALHAATLSDVEQQAKQAATATEEAGQSADKAGGFMSSAADKAKALAIGLGAAAAAGLKMGADVVGEVDRMNAQLGLTGDAAQQLGGEVGTVLRSGLAGGAEEAAGAVGALTSQFSYLGFEGEKTAAELSRNFLAFTQTFGVDMAETTQTVGQLVANGLAADVTEGIDLLTSSFQRVPAAMRDELPEIINEYGTNFRALGFSGEEAFGVLVSAADKGKWALDKTGDALKEFTIRGSDMSKASTEAYTALGLSAEDMARKLAEGGPAARDALNQTASALLAMEDPALRANTAIALFGTPLEDLSVDQIPQFLEGLTGADAAMTGFAGSSEELAQGIENSLSGRLNAAKGVLLDLAGNAFMAAWDAAQRGIDIFREYQPLIAGVTIVLGALALGMTAYSIAQSAAAAGGFLAFMKNLTVVTRAQAAAQFLLNTAMWTSPITWIVAGIAALVAGLVYFFTQTETGKAVWDSLVLAFTTGWEWVKNAFAVAWGFIQPILSGIWSGIQFIGAVFGAILLGTVLVAWNLFSAAIQFAWNAFIKPVWDAFAFVMQWLWTSVLQPIWSGMQVAFQALGAFFSWVWTAVIQPMWNAFGAGVQIVWNTVIRPAWDAMKAALGAVGSFFQWVWNSVIKPAWDALGNGIRFVIDSVIKPAFDGVKSALQSVGDFFGTIVDGIRSVWDQLKGHVARPINFVIDTVWNNGLVKAWNTIADFLPGLPRASTLSPVAFAEGGPVPLTPGATRGKDSVHAVMMPDEHVWDVQDVARSGGHQAQYQMRGMIERGQPFTWVDGRVVPAGHGLEPQRFADGGAVGKGARLEPTSGEGGLQPIAILAKRLIHRIWPSITEIGGYRQDAYPEHPSGRALDVMVGVGNPIGDEVTGWALANDHILPLIHALWKQTVWMPGGATQPMEDRGDPTQNHMDHPHLWYHPKAVDPNVVPEGLVGHDGLTRDDRLGVIKEKIGEILDKALDPIREGMARAIGEPPPELLGIPPRALDETKTAAVDGAFAFAENIAGDLKEVYNQAKDVVTSITGLFRDEGGPIPTGMSIVNNETGKPEQVFNWKQVDQFRRILESAKDLDHLWEILREFGNLAVTGDFTSRLRELAGSPEDSELVDAILSMREQFHTGLGELQSSMAQVVEAAGEKARKGYESELLDFFGFKGLVDAGRQVWDAFNPTTSQAAAGKVTSGITGGAGTVDTGLVYGDPNLTYETKQVELETKMPALSESGVPGSGPVKDQVKEAFAAYGWDKEPFWSATEWIVGKESTWDPMARNPSSGAFGLFQFLGGTKQQYLPDENPNPKIQGEAGAKYIKDRYGDPLKAKAFWEANGWYDNGGWLMPGLTMAMNGTGQPEAILTAAQWERFDNLLTSLPSAAQFERIAALADTDSSDAPVARPSGPLLVIEKLEARDEAEAMRAASREARRLTRSTGLVGGWRD